MKHCETCQASYADEALKFCRRDGGRLVGHQSVSDSSPTVVLDVSRGANEFDTQPVEGCAPSVAVLPFVNMSSDSENDYLCDGLAEELINALAKSEKLKVAARTSAFSFKAKHAKIGEIGRALNVSAVVEGSIRKSGNRLRVTVQLINASDGYHLWSERYDRRMEDIFDLQDDITLAVVNALRVKLLGEEKAAVFKRYTTNTKAYEAYLKARYQLNKYTAECWHSAIRYFEKAMVEDPDYALAYAGIALCRNILWYYSLLPPHEIVPRWKAAVDRALEIDGGLSEARLSLANIYFLYDWRWDDAEREYRKAIALNPNSADAHQSYALFLTARERIDEAISEARKAIELDPLSLLINLHVGWVFWNGSREDDALEQVRRLIEIEPGFNGAYWLLGSVHLAKGLHEEAIEAYEKSLTLGGNQIVLADLGATYGIFGRRDDALRVLGDLLEMRKKQHVAAISIARVYSGLGETDLAFEWLEKAYEERNGEMVFLRRAASVGTGDAIGESTRNDPRFTELLRRMRLV